jgi:hypothetical protein
MLQQEFSDLQDYFSKIFQQVVNIESITLAVCLYVLTLVVASRGHGRDIPPSRDSGHPGILLPWRRR